MHKTLLVILTAALLPAPAGAQETSPIVTRGSVTAGTQQVSNDTNSSKFTEYRDLRDRARSGIGLNIFDTRNGRYFEFSGVDFGSADQTVGFRGGEAGRWSLFGSWLDVPHNFSNKAQTPYIRRAPGVFEVPANIPITFKTLATAAAHAPSVVAMDALAAEYQRAYLQPTDLALQRTFGRFGFTYAGPLAVAATYDRRRAEGLKSTFGPVGDRPPRTLNIQLTEPVDTSTQDLTLSVEHVGRAFQVQAAYHFSDFQNRIDTLLWENVWTTQAGDQSYDAWDRAISTFGRRPLSPDNRYQNLSLTVGADLPFESRLNATVALGLFDQNQTLLPYSYHVDRLAVQQLPRTTAQGDIRTTQLLVDYFVAPTPRTNLRAWVRHYGMDNRTPQGQWWYVTQDTSNLNGTVSYKNKRVNLAYASDRTTAGAEATFRARPARTSLTVGYELEDVARDFRETDTTEHRLTAAVRMRPQPWANLRVRYLFGQRDGDYDPYAPRQSYWYAPADVGTDQDNPQFTFSNHPDMVRYDVADRRRHQTDATLTFTAGTASVSLTARYRSDDFESGVSARQPLAGTALADQNATTPGQQLGFLDDARLRYGVDAFFLPAERVSLNAFLALDRGTAFERSLEFNENNKQNPSAVQNAELGPWTRGGSIWSSDVTDRTVTAGLGTSLTVVPERFILSATYSASLAKLDIDYQGFGRTNWDGTPFPPNHQFFFTSPPSIRHNLHSFDLRGEVPIMAGLTLLAGYGYERYRIDDWQQSARQDWVEPVGSEFLLRDTSRSHQWGNRLFNLGTYLAPGYDGHFGWTAFTYRF
jgi:MtrB/PioB family decaheme-associated outer membrane protein